MNLVIIGDVGQKIYHVGDEAMCLAAIEQISKRLPDIKFTILSRNPQETKLFYGHTALQTLTPPYSVVGRKRFLERIYFLLQNPDSFLPEEASIFAVFDVIKNSAGLVIAGGGNLNSIFGWLLVERAALVAIAKHFGKPTIVCSQTIGPTLLEDEKVVLSELVERTSLFALREKYSFKLARTVNPDYKYFFQTLDDASYLSVPVEARSVWEEYGDYICATFQFPNNIFDATSFYKQVAKSLDEVAEITNKQILLVPHMGDLEEEGVADEFVHQQIKSFCSSALVSVVTQLKVEETFVLTKHACLVLTSRYHPNVFAMAGNVPVVSLAMEQYSYTRMCGALANWGLADFCLPVTALYNKDFVLAVAYVWENREQIVGFIEKQQRVRQEMFSFWWDLVCGVIKSEDFVCEEEGLFVEAVSYGEVFGGFGGQVWWQNSQALQSWFNEVCERNVLLSLEVDMLRGEVVQSLEDVEGQLAKVLGSKFYCLVSKVRDFWYRGKNFLVR